MAAPNRLVASGIADVLGIGTATGLQGGRSDLHITVAVGRHGWQDSPITERKAPAMEYRQITDDFAVTGQISAEDIAAIKAAGFKSVIGNRPDTEEGAVAHGEIEAAARAAGLDFRFIPVVASAITPEDVEKMADALDEMQGPIFAYCRSGARSTNLYSMARDLKR